MKASLQTILDNTSEKLAKRDSMGRLLPGQQSINPHGRPKGSKNFTSKFKEVISKFSNSKDSEGANLTYEDMLIKTVLKKAIVDEDTSMIKLIWNYMDGVPGQYCGENSFDDNQNFGLDSKTKARIDKIFQRNSR